MDTTISNRSLSANEKQTKQRTLMSDVYDRLRRDVLDGVLKPGARLRFEELRSHYGVGLSPLREALTRLSAEKLVLLEEHKGFRVAPISKADLLDILFMRKEIESMGIRLSIQHGDDRWEGGVVAAIHELRKRKSLDDEGRIDSEWELRHKAFHYSLVSACGSPRLLQVRDLLFDHADRYRRLSHHYPAEVRDHLAEHIELSDAVVARDADAACYLIKRHLERTVQILLGDKGLQIEDDA
ncbi:FCD domain-containing protein [Ensifer adhaerens]|uniref:FCD domain-containing protein n=1 Tax=Ensifer adhaerens TaxID=106592 RepID=UPI001444F70B|nr:FCD domain-containing protein [Ensifer adhaerens]MDF8357671.1 FCD domain-containing protein [Ensifer adhaerens]